MVNEASSVPNYHFCGGQKKCKQRIIFRKHFLKRSGLKLFPRLSNRNPDSGSSQGREYKQGFPLSLYLHFCVDHFTDLCVRE